MARLSFYGPGIPGLDPRQLSGKLIVVEGADGVGRSAQIWLLKRWLEIKGHAVLVTRTSRSTLAGKKLRRAKKGTTLGRATMALFYATDFADRLEHEIVPALRAGFIVLADRYIYTLLARAVVRGIDPEWIREAYGFALKPDKIFYLRAGVDDLVMRVLREDGFDYWESGMDLHLGGDMYESFVQYQTRMLVQFDKMIDEYGFVSIDASRSIEEIFNDLKAKMSAVLHPAVAARRDSIERVGPPRKVWATQDASQTGSMESSFIFSDGGPPADNVIEFPHNELRARLVR